jgi:hypothetical protein
MWQLPSPNRSGDNWFIILRLMILNEFRERNAFWLYGCEINSIFLFVMILSDRIGVLSKSYPSISLECGLGASEESRFLSLRVLFSNNCLSAFDSLRSTLLPRLQSWPPPTLSTRNVNRGSGINTKSGGGWSEKVSPSLLYTGRLLPFRIHPPCRPHVGCGLHLFFRFSVTLPPRHLPPH